MATLQRLAIRDFRNIERAELELPDEGVAIVGENGQGKTNLLEAIYYFQLFRSMRGARDQDLIRFDAPAFHVAARVTTRATTRSRRETHEVSAAFERAGKRKKVVVDGTPTPRLSDALGTLPSVIVSPRDVELVTGAPSERRRFIDVALALTSRRYLAALQHYRAALLRRNSALRDTARTGRGEETVAVWEPALAEHGAVLTAARADWVERNADTFAHLCATIGERAAVRMRYATSVATPHDAHGAHDALLQALEQKRPLDIRRGLTHAGPHRDDLTLALGGRDLRQFGSAGQQRTAAIALRMLEAATLREHLGDEPLLLLDDPFAELDTRRAAHILALLRDAGVGQTVLVVPRPTDVPPELTRLERWRVEAGIFTSGFAPAAA